MIESSPAGYRRIFAHTCTIFFARGIARPETGEISSLRYAPSSGARSVPACRQPRRYLTSISRPTATSAEPHEDSTLVVSLFEIDASGDAIPAFIEREHEFRFMAVSPIELHSDKSIGEFSRLRVVEALSGGRNRSRARCPVPVLGRAPGGSLLQEHRRGLHQGSEHHAGGVPPALRAARAGPHLEVRLPVPRVPHFCVRGSSWRDEG